jgi:hypothetical protein
MQFPCCTCRSLDLFWSYLCFFPAVNPPGYKYVPSASNPTMVACGKDTYSLGLRFQTECTPCPSGFATSPVNALGSHTSPAVCSEYLYIRLDVLMTHACAIVSSAVYAVLQGKNVCACFPASTSCKHWPADCSLRRTFPLFLLSTGQMPAVHLAVHIRPCAVAVCQPQLKQQPPL